MGSELFNLFQYGQESTRGTPVACTRLWVGKMGNIKSDRKPVYPPENYGVRSEAQRSIISQYFVQNTVQAEHGAFQHLPFLFQCGVKGGVTPSEQTVSQGDYLWTHTPSMIAANNPNSFTARFGDDAQAWIAEYCMFEKIRISGQVSQGTEASPVRIEADYFGRQLQTTTFTSALSGPSLEPMNAKLARLYVDPSWANIGVTEITNVLKSFDIEIITGVSADFTGSANKYFDTHNEGPISVTGVFGLKGGASVNTLFASHLANTFQALRLKIIGGQIGTGQNHSLTIDMGGTLEDASPISGADRSVNQATMALRAYYDKTGAKLAQFAISTDINAI